MGNSSQPIVPTIVEPIKYESTENPQSIQAKDEALDEIESYLKSSPNNPISVVSDPKNKHGMIVIFKGKQKTFHKGAIYLLQIIFSESYKKRLPLFGFVGVIPFHCNVGSRGALCSDFLVKLKSKSFSDILLQINHNIYNPNNKSPQNSLTILSDKSKESQCEKIAKISAKKNNINEVFKLETK